VHVLRSDDPMERAEAEAILRDRIEALEGMSWYDLDAFGEKEEIVESPGGRRFRVVTRAYWDTEEWASGMELDALAYVDAGWRRRFPYRLHSVRGGPNDLVPEPPPDWVPGRWFLGIRLRRGSRTGAA
jgi:hypothetical protein